MPSIKTITTKKPTAEIIIGDFHIMINDKVFTKKQIKHIKWYFGWDVRNLEE